MKVVNIKWDTDGDMEIFEDLPQEIAISDCIVEECEDDELLEEISVSDGTLWEVQTALCFR